MTTMMVPYWSILFAAHFFIFTTTVTNPVLAVEYVDVDTRLQVLPDCYIKKVPVVVVAYLPSADGVFLDSEITGVHNTTIAEMKAKILEMNIQTKFMLEEGTRFRGYSDPEAMNYAGYQVVQYIFVYENFLLGEEVGWKPGLGYYRPDYNDVMNKINGQYVIEELGVEEVWLWGWHYGPIEPAESNMSSPLTGDISNSERFPDDLPVYNNTYILYNYNYDRSANEAVHNHGHQIEAQLSHINQLQDHNTTLFREKFVGWQGGTPPLGRAGDTHHPPNTQKDYEYDNPTSVKSDIADWRPDGGKEKQVNRDTWGDIDYAWPENNPAPGLFEPNWYIYWMQNMPGIGNTIDYGDNFMTNWWIPILDWDDAIINDVGLYAVTPAETGICPVRQFITKDTTAQWMDVKAWVDGLQPDPEKIEGSVEINGYITREGDIKFKNASGVGDTLYINDTLVVEGSLTFNENRVLKIGPDAVVIITGGISLDKGINIVNRGVLAVKGDISTKSDSRILFIDRVPPIEDPGPSAYPEEPVYSDGNSILEEDLPYTPRFFHIPGGGPLLDIAFITGGPFSPRGPVEDSVYMKAPDPFPSDPDSDLVKAIWAFLGTGKFPLPVRLLDFKASVDAKDVVLEWSTSWEVDNDFFTLERSYDGYRYEFIGSVDGGGTTSQTIKYRFIDHDPLPGMVFYRLSQTDFDGSKEIFRPVSLFLEPGNQKMALFPNPLREEVLHMRIPALERGKEALLYITDLTGKTVMKESIPVEKVESARLDIEIANWLKPGIYIVRLQQGNAGFVASLIKE